MLQTVGDAVGQLARILIYMAAAGLVTKGWISQEQLVEVAGYVMIVVTGAWTIYWNRRQVVTVDGMAAAAKNPSLPISGASSLEIKAAKA